MLKKRIITVITISLITIVSSSRLYALSVGGYLNGTGGVSSIRSVHSTSDVEYSIGYGFLLDTALARDKTFNYRFGAGYENISKGGNNFFDKLCFHRISLSNTFGFSFYRTSKFRLWMGPQVEFSSQFAQIEERRIDVLIYRVNGYVVHSTYHSINFAVFSLGVGAVLGLNINFEKQFSMIYELGINASIGVGPFSEKKSWYMYNHEVSTFPDSTSHSYDDLFNKIYIFTKLGFMYRIKDEFITEGPDKINIKLQRK